VSRIPALGWYALAAAILLAGFALAAVLVSRFIEAFEPPVRFFAPGTTELSVPQPGRYILWHEHRTVYGGRSYDVPPPLPDGTRFSVAGPRGTQVEIQPHAGMSSEGSDGRSVSVGRFEAPVAGQYRVTVDGGFEPRVIAVAQDRVWPILKLVAQVAFVVLAALGVAVGLALQAFLRTVQPPAGARAGPEAPASMRRLVTVVYGLQAASLLVGVTLFAGVILNYLRRAEAAGTWLESHFTWQIRTFWWSLAWCVLGAATAVLLVGFAILAVSAIWFVYRIARGWTELNEGRPMYA
jgi:uncharacterized membrane protein